jgi:hypothetical protein
MTPVEYSVLITSTPSTHSVSWPRPRPEPRMKPTGSVRTRASRGPACGPFQLAAVSQVNSEVRPMVTTMKTITVQTVERTDRIFVHSEASRWLKPVPRVGATAGALAGVTAEVVVIGCLPGPRSPDSADRAG